MFRVGADEMAIKWAAVSRTEPSFSNVIAAVAIQINGQYSFILLTWDLKAMERLWGVMSRSSPHCARTFSNSHNIYVAGPDKILDLHKVDRKELGVGQC